MKNFLLTILITLPFIGNSQVANPERIIATTQAGFTATASSAAGEGPAANAVDGNIDNFWTSNWETSEDFPHWLQVNMGSSMTITGIYLIARNRTQIDGNIQECTIETSTDGSTWIQQGGTINPKSRALIPGKQYLEFSAPVTCTYYKITITNNYGTFTGSYVNPATDLAETGAITGITTPDATAYERTAWIATSSSSNDGEGPVKNAIDNDPNTFWTTGWGQINDFDHSFYQVDMGAVQQVNRISYQQRGNGTSGGRNSRITQGYISYGNDLADTLSWVTVPVTTWEYDDATTATNHFIELPIGLSFRYFRVNITQNYGTMNSTGDKTTTIAELRAHYSVALPITLSSFSAITNKDAVDLKWTTASESNSDKFIVTRASDGKTFTEIGSVKAAGNSAVIQEYHFADLSPMAGMNYYRLVQVDKDGKTTFSDVKAAKYLHQSKIAFTIKSLNMASIQLAVYSPAAGKGKLIISNTSGQRITSQQVNLDKGNTNIQIPLNVASGVYIVTLTNDKTTISKKFRM